MTERSDLAAAPVVAQGPYDLLLDFSELARLLAGAVRRGDWLDAYLFAVGLNQIAEDTIRADIGVAGAAADRLLAGDGRARTTAGRVAARALTVAQDLRGIRGEARRLAAWQHDLAALVLELARRAIGREDRGVVEPALAAETDRLVTESELLPVSLRGQVARLPACFQAFDLDLPDVDAMAREFERREGDRSRPLVVVGVRTSGSYLAPLLAALLESRGHADIRVITHRPQTGLGRAERAVVRERARSGGVALVVDDPPGSGHSVARVLDELGRLGLPQASLVPCLPLFGGRDSLPERLARYAPVVLPGEDWAIGAKLEPEAVGAALGRLAGAEIERVEPLPLPPPLWERSHRRGLFRVELGTGPERRVVSVLVEGVGIGYYGRQAVVVGQALPGHVPQIFGFADGCLYRAWQAEDRQACAAGGAPSEALVGRVAGYVVARREALPAKDDRSVGLFGERPVWEVASGVLSNAFARAAPVARLLLVDTLVKHLLRVDRPSVIDGATSLAHWFADERDAERLVKVGWASRSFWNLGLHCYDAAYDLVGAAVSSDDEATAARLRSAFERAGGEAVSPERWLLYELAQLWGHGRTRPGESLSLERAMARSLQRYFATLYLGDLEPTATGPLCAFDLDGVLDTGTLGFPATTGSGALALRALIAHGYRPVLVSGRSASEVADRCRAYRLAGGVAEYGSVVHTAHPQETQVLVDDGQAVLVARARESLGAAPGVRLDDAYRHVVRAFVAGRDGRRGPVDPETAAAALAASGDPGGLRLVPGDGQTDVVAAGVDKGRGARELAKLLGWDEEGPAFALAVGDTLQDLPLLAEAALAFAPAHAGRVLKRAGVEVLRAPYQAGVALAVERLIGHRPGGCAACRPPELTADSALLVALLSAGEGGRIELVRRFAGVRRALRRL